ncbi:MAG: N-acetyl-gamma-glutamyl-phosphate reductase [Candidatus Aquicultor secundus]|nr:MAG: N-acetyl-gamma-glutamyl-phosphate reductase [Candidatus Aquicultor secundus]PIX52054.1 MAG: N-acetyl-gamma-glutamyl-phosphate reductase [Candidatus Aquicultor secundus]
MAVKVGIIGASGYTGAELIRLAAVHPEMSIEYITANRYQGTAVRDLYPQFTGISDAVYEAYNLDTASGKADLFFLALPHGKAMEVAPELLNAGHKVIDLSGDFRLSDVAVYESWYKTRHTNPELIGKAVYGLPELYEEKIKKADFISNPGCYPTSALLALAPLLSEKLAKTGGIIVDSLSGVSGTGRDPKPGTHFCAVDESLTAYKVGGVHQHTPEIEQYLSDISGEAITVSFTPHLMPISRGILTTAYAEAATTVNLDELIDLYKSFYKDKPFVAVLPKGQYPQTKSVMGSNCCQIGLAHDERTNRIIAISAIDNLVKGASGQAVQNMNIMLGLPQDMGLRYAGLMP